MKRSINGLIGFTIGATDGEIGKVTEFYFDDITWTIRYLIVETGSWLFGRKVLISPVSVLTTNWDNNIFYVNLTMEQIKNSPDIDTEKPVSRQHELDMYAYYPWGSYWGDNLYTVILPPPIPEYDNIFGEEKFAINSTETGDPHLRSTENVIGYSIKALDGEIGKAADFLIEDSNWKIDFIVVDAGSWLNEKNVLMSPKWIKEIKWATEEIIISASIAHVKNSPEYDNNQTLNESEETKLYKYYDGLISHSI